MRIFILNGPNLNMLGSREPEIYGSETLSDIEVLCREAGDKIGAEIDFRQSNHEGELVEWVQEAARSKKYDGVAINAAGFTHTSVALHDALKLLDIPIIEVHISDPKAREDFRHKSYIEPLASAVFAGYGAKSYVMAVEKLGELLKT